MKIEVVDAIHGSGKTEGIIKWMNENSGRYLYVVDSLRDVDNAVETCQNISFNTLDGDNKRLQLVSLLEAGRSVACSYKTFNKVSEDMLLGEALSEYTLVFNSNSDLVTSVSGVFSKDIKYLLGSGKLIKSEQDKGRVLWNDDNDDRWSYDKLSKYFQDGEVLICNNKNSTIVNSVQTHFFRNSGRVILLNSCFDGSLNEAFFNLKGIKTKVFTEDLDLTPIMEIKSNTKNLVSVSNTRSSNNIKHLPQSYNWYTRVSKKGDIGLISTALRSIYRKYKREDVMVITPKDLAVPKRFSNHGKTLMNDKSNIIKQYVSSGTGKLPDDDIRTTLIQGYSKHISTSILIFFSSYGIELSHDKYAEKDMLKWLWLSDLRNGGKINLYFLNERMESIYNNWLNSVITADKELDPQTKRLISEQN